jgi:tRNA pseudouridine38-40 synthase
MAHYQINLAYDGTEFQGFQRQGTKRTVQLEIEKALRQLGWTGEAIISAGRTDTGVHACDQVAAFDLAWDHSQMDLKNALNANLPEDISIHRIGQVNADFHPRFDAIARAYRYAIFPQCERNPLRERFAWRIEQPVRKHLLDQAAEILKGMHDFGEFGRAMKPGNTTLRTIFFAGWKKRPGGILDFEVIADAFLYHMVRRMVFLQVQVGQGRLDLTAFQEAVQLKKKATPGIAPPNGLCLVQVFYDQARLDEWNSNQALDIEDRCQSI